MARLRYRVLVTLDVGHHSDGRVGVKLAQPLGAQGGSGSSSAVRRGDIFIARVPAPVGSRPVLIVTRTAAIAVRNAVTIAPVTRTVRHIPSEPLGRAHGLKARSVANCDSLQTIPKHAIRKRPIGSLTTDELPLLDRALRSALGIRI